MKATLIVLFAVVAVAVGGLNIGRGALERVDRDTSVYGDAAGANADARGENAIAETGVMEDRDGAAAVARGSAQYGYASASSKMGTIIARKNN